MLPSTVVARAAFIDAMPTKKANRFQSRVQRLLDSGLLARKSPAIVLPCPRPGHILAVARRAAKKSGMARYLHTGKTAVYQRSRSKSSRALRRFHFSISFRIRSLRASSLSVPTDTRFSVHCTSSEAPLGALSCCCGLPDSDEPRARSFNEPSHKPGKASTLWQRDHRALGDPPRLSWTNLPKSDFPGI